MQLSRNNLILVFIVLAGAVLRLSYLGFQVPDIDEGWTVYLSQLPAWEIVKYSIIQDFNPPGFYLAAHLSQILFGAGVVAARLPSVVAGILLIPVVYLIGKELDGEELGLVSAGAVAVLHPAIYYSQYARGFELAAFLFAVTTLAFIRIQKGQDAWAMFAVSGVAALYVHAFVLVPLVLMAGFLLVLAPERSRVFLGMGVLAVPFFVMMGFIGLNRHGVYGLPVWKVAAILPIEFFSYGFPIVAVLFLYACLKNQNIYVAPLVAVSALTCFFLVVLAPFMPVFPRYALPVMPMVLVVAMVPVRDWVREKNPMILALAAGFLVIQAVELWVGWTMPRMIP